MTYDSDYLIVYGTLRSAFENKFAQHLRQHSQYVGEGVFPGLLFDLGHYPGAIYQSTSAIPVVGSIYDIAQYKSELLPYLDYYEGIGIQFDQPTEYVRVVIPVYIDNRIINCWIYHYNLQTDDKVLIETGDYMKYIRSIPPKNNL